MNLKERWIEFFKKINAKGNPNKFFDKIIKHYSEPHRAYHTLKHIKNSLKEFDEVKDLCEKPNEVEFAIWFHDIIYNPRKDNNEEKSADLAYKKAKEMNLSKNFAEDIKQFILASKHQTTPTRIDAQIMIDIDLAGFGKSEKEFWEQNKLVRKEYSFYSDKDFNLGRSILLNSFLIRSHIYLTKHFRKKYETQARKNIKKMIKKLTS